MKTKEKDSLFQGRVRVHPINSCENCYGFNCGFSVKNDRCMLVSEKGRKVRARIIPEWCPLPEMTEEMAEFWDNTNSIYVTGEGERRQKKGKYDI